MTRIIALFAVVLAPAIVAAQELMPIVSQAVAAMRARAADKGAQRTPGTAKGKAKLTE